MHKLLAITGTLILAATQLPANTYLFTTPAGGTSGGLPVDVSASFAIGTNSMTVTLTNNQSNPTAVDQILTYMTFDIAGPITNVSISSPSNGGAAITINSNAPADYSVASAAPVQWNMASSGNSTVHVGLCDFQVSPCNGTGSRWPKLGLIGGPGPGNAYSSANGSITTSAHPPFIFQTAIFTITAAGLPLNPTSSPISNVTFGFGTNGTESLIGLGGEVPLPEPNPAILLLAGLGFLSLRLRRRR